MRKIAEPNQLKLLKRMIANADIEIYHLAYEGFVLLYVCRGMKISMVLAVAECNDMRVQRHNSILLEPSSDRVLAGLIPISAVQNENDTIP